MGLEVASYREEHEPLVRAFNRRMEAGGSDWKFYDHAKPKWLPVGAAAEVRREYFVAADETPAVHGGYCLKFQSFSARGEKLQIASLQGPVSEGVIDPRYSLLAVRLIRDMERREPKLFAWGASERIAALFSKLGWQEHKAPLLTRIFRAGRVLRLSGQLRAAPHRRPLLDVLAATGIGQFGAALTHLALTAANGGLGTPKLQVKVVERFGPWADEVWRSCSQGYGLIGWRDADSLNAMLPPEGWPQAAILKMEEDGQPVGWAAVRDTRFARDPRFGDLYVGSIIDSLAVPGREAAVVRAATEYLRAKGVDLAVSIYSHGAWVTAFQACGYLVSRGRRSFFASPKLGAMELASLTDVHLTPLDGDGPHGF